jgi:hypothetical protein
MSQKHIDKSHIGSLARCCDNNKWSFITWPEGSIKFDDYYSFENINEIVLVLDISDLTRNKNCDATILVQNRIRKCRANALTPA